MDSSSSATSSSNSLNKGAVFPASSGGRPRWPDLPIYESTPHYPPPMENGRLLANPSSSYSTNYAYDYANYNYGGGGGGGGAGSTTAAAEKREEDEEGGERSEFTAAAVEREHMFDKVVTPSDVGKLNRLVIPKQHAERYFPLDSNSGDSKGLLLNFEDRTGKSWRFRYSYWNSSQSYVMTKGWSRFVKEKKLDAGDIVSFHRGMGDSSAKEHFYIDWRRRPDAPPSHHHHYPLYPRGGGLQYPYPHQHHPAVDANQFQQGFAFHRPIHHPQFYLSHPLPPPARYLNLQRGSVVSYNGVTTNNSSSGVGGGYGSNYGTASPNFRHQQQTASVIYLGAAATASSSHQQMQMPIQGEGSSQRDNELMVFDSVPVVHGGKVAASSKRLRLFGVNMDCTDVQDECDVSEQRQHTNRHHHQHQHQDLVLDSDRISSSSSESALQLRLSGASAASPSTGTGSDFVDKGKSSMSLDLDLDI